MGDGIVNSLTVPYTFSDRILDNRIYFHVTKLCDSFVLWIGSSSTLGNLAVAIKTKFDATPSGTQLLGDSTDTVSASMAKRLAKKTGKQVYVSYNLPQDSMLMPLVERRLMEELKAHPEKF